MYIVTESLQVSINQLTINYHTLKTNIKIVSNSFNNYDIHDLYRLAWESHSYIINHTNLRMEMVEPGYVHVLPCCCVKIYGM